MAKHDHVRLTADQKRQICEHKVQHHDLTLNSLALWAQKQFNLAKPPSDGNIWFIVEKGGCRLPKLTQVRLTAPQRRRLFNYKLQHPAKTLPALALWAQKQFHLPKPPCPKAISHALQKTKMKTASYIPQARLTAEEKRLLYEYKIQNCSITLSSLALWAQNQFFLFKAPSIATLSQILKAEALTSSSKSTTATESKGSDEESNGKVGVFPDLPLLERVLVYFSTNHKIHRNTVPTLRQVQDKGLQIAEALSLNKEDVNFSFPWLDWFHFRKRHGLSGDIIIWMGRDSVLPALHAKELSIAELLELASNSGQDEYKDQVAHLSTSKGSTELERALILFILHHQLRWTTLPSQEAIEEKGRHLSITMGSDPDSFSLSKEWLKQYREFSNINALLEIRPFSATPFGKLGRVELSDKGLLQSEGYSEANKRKGANSMDDTDIDQKSSEYEHAGDYINISSDEDDDGEADKFSIPGDYVNVSDDDNEQGNPVEMCSDANADMDISLRDDNKHNETTVTTPAIAGTNSWSLEEKLRALFVVIPLFDPFTPQQQEVYAVLYDLYVRTKVPGYEQDPIETTARDWTREKRDSLSIVMTLLDMSVESHRSTHLALNRELERLDSEE
ncbi:hypothetical protein BGX28_006233 [Mortierella sp. GBA30]|nr:hypothetical protein BGX28_006233 [Mortierella sp. GBA30]